MIYAKQYPYVFKKLPTPLLKSNKLDNITIVPASLLPFKKVLHELTNNLPKGTILICHHPGNIKQKIILDGVGLLFKQKGYYVKSVSSNICL